MKVKSDNNGMPQTKMTLNVFLLNKRRENMEVEITEQKQLPNEAAILCAK